MRCKSLFLGMWNTALNWRAKLSLLFGRYDQKPKKTLLAMKFATTLLSNTIRSCVCGIYWGPPPGSYSSNIIVLAFMARTYGCSTISCLLQLSISEKMGFFLNRLRFPRDIWQKVFENPNFITYHSFHPWAATHHWVCGGSAMGATTN